MSRFSTFFAQVFSGKGRTLKWEALLQIIWVLVGTAIFVCTSRPTPPIQLFLHLFHLLLPDYSLFLRLLLLLLLHFLHLTFPLLSLLPPFSSSSSAPFSSSSSSRSPPVANFGEQVAQLCGSGDEGELIKTTLHSRHPETHNHPDHEDRRG